MMIFISCAKTMAQTCPNAVPYVSEPEYLPYAEELVKKMAAFSEDELADALKVSPRIAAENKMRYTDILHGEAEMMPAVFAYTGVVFKHMAPQSFSAADLAYAQEHLRITSFLYGLLRPLDAISPYRLEGGMKPDPGSGKSIFNHWQKLLTENFIAEIKANGGILVNLASDEMKKLFDWKKIESEVRVIHPEFLSKGKNGKTKTTVIYAKMCRGEMARHILLNRIERPESLKEFSNGGFVFARDLSTCSKYVFVKEQD